MCLISYISEPLVAKEDIVCYKVLHHLGDNCYVSPFRNMPYKINSVNYPETVFSESDIKLTELYCYSIGNGFLHCYRSCGVPLSYYDFKQQISCPLYLFECYIPKGAKYFINRNGTEVCADKLFVKDIKQKID